MIKVMVVTEFIFPAIGLTALSFMTSYAMASVMVMSIGTSYYPFGPQREKTLSKSDHLKFIQVEHTSSRLITAFKQLWTESRH